jgi:hypothetical protein
MTGGALLDMPGRLKKMKQRQAHFEKMPKAI